jgi:hypothetical protein
MNIYTNNDYRKIYESHHGTIPKDEDGRTYEIHHIDGDHENNAIENLQCVTIQEHYDIHYSQEDWGACYRMSKRMRLTPEEISDLARKANLKRVDAGVHPWLKRADGSSVGKEITLKRVKDKTHNLLKRADGTSHASDKVKDKTHHLLKREDGTNINTDRVEAGTHNFLTRADGSSVSKETNLKRVKAGVHNLLCHGDPKKHTQYDHTIYSFIHKTGIAENCTQYDLRMKYNLHPGNMSSMVRGRKSVSGWRLV